MPQVENRMMLFTGAVIVSIAVMIGSRLLVRSGDDTSAIGWMSEQWLAEHRASQSR
jgi:hypothetical protein